MRRTEYSENFLGEFVSRPLVREFVFLSPQFQKGKPDKELCDLLLILRKQAMPIQMKCQEDPSVREGDKLRQWVLKQAEKALSQIQGTIRTVRERDFWCRHARRGHVSFSPGVITPIHGIVLTEHFTDPVLLADFPVEYEGVPLSYFTVNDFLNVVNELRSFTELSRYLEGRRNLAPETLLSIGGERALFEHYLLNESFPASRDEAVAWVAANQEALAAALRFKRKNEAPAGYIEYIADSLATRSETYRDGLSAEQMSHYEPDDSREAYLKMQEELCDLPYAARRDLGARFLGASDLVRNDTEPSAMRFCAAFIDSKPDFLYVYVSGRGIPRGELIARAQKLLPSGLAWYGKSSGIAIVDRDRESFEVLLIRDFSSTEDDRKLGEYFFGKVRMDHVVGRIVT